MKLTALARAQQNKIDKTLNRKWHSDPIILVLPDQSLTPVNFHDQTNKDQITVGSFKIIVIEFTRLVNN